MVDPPAMPAAGSTQSGSAAPPNPGERALKTIFQLLALSFAVVGMIFFLFPDGTLRVINAAGAVFRIFPPAHPSVLRFWLSLGVSYMALVTILAVMIQSDPRRYRHLMPVLAAGKFCSSFTCLLFFAFSSPAFIYLLNFLVDGSITLLVLGCYLWEGITEESAARGGWTRRSGLILDAVIDTLLPAGGAFAVGGRDTALASDLWQYFAALHVRGPLGLELLLGVLEYGPFLFGPRRIRFTRLSPVEREQYLAGFEHSRLAPRRQLIAGLKLIAMLHFYDYPEARAAVGYDSGYLRDKLLAGPNAAHHRARLQ